jgi:hypothetical protein
VEQVSVNLKNTNAFVGAKLFIVKIHGGMSGADTITQHHILMV